MPNSLDTGRDLCLSQAVPSRCVLFKRFSIGGID
jgi:hypothetical protein